MDKIKLMKKVKLLMLIILLLVPTISEAQLPDLEANNFDCFYEREENGCYFYTCSGDKNYLMRIEDDMVLHEFYTSDPGVIILKEGEDFDCNLDSGDYTITYIDYTSNQFYIVTEDNNLYKQSSPKPDRISERETGVLTIFPSPDIETDYPIRISSQDLSFLSSPQRVNRNLPELSIRDPQRTIVSIPAPDFSFIPEPRLPSDAPSGETPEKKVEVDTGDLSRRTYGNTMRSDNDLNNPISVGIGNSLELDSRKSFDEFGPIPPAKKRWYVFRDVSRAELESAMASLPEPHPVFVYGLLFTFPGIVYRYSLADDIEPNYHDIINPSFEGSDGDRYLVVLSIEDFLGESVTLQMFEVVLDRRIASSSGEVPTWGSGGGEETSGRGDQFNPSNFPSCSAPQPAGTICYNDRWVPALYNQWSCKESDFLQQELYNNPLNPSICNSKPDVCGCLNSAGAFITDCSSFSHVAEYSCENTCQSPIKIEPCPPEYQCISTLNSAGACKQIPYEHLIEGPSSIISLEKPPIYTDKVALQLTDTDLINLALCNSNLGDLSGFKILKAQVSTALVIKQFTGFFAKITGKQTSPRSSETAYSGTIETRAYSELASLEYPYLDISQDEARFLRIDLGKARFLNRKIGSALLKEFGYTQGILDSAVQTQGASFTHTYVQNLLSGVGPATSGLSLRKSPELGFKFTLPPDTYGILFNINEDWGLQKQSLSMTPEEFSTLQFILVETRENKFIKIDNIIYSVSRGLYIVPFPMDERVRYSVIENPMQDPSLRPYYELPTEIRRMEYDVGTDKPLEIPFLNPSEGHYLLRNLPADLELMEKSFKYRGTDVKYRIIPLDPPAHSGDDYGGFKKAIFFVPENNIVVLDNEYSTIKSLRQKPGSRYSPPGPATKLAYNMQYFDIVRQSLADKSWEEYKNSFVGWLNLNIVQPIIDHYRNPDPTFRTMS